MSQTCLLSVGLDLTHPAALGGFASHRMESNVSFLLNVSFWHPGCNVFLLSFRCHP